MPNLYPVGTPAPNRERQQAAYLITFVCYGSWLHGREGAVDREHNIEPDDSSSVRVGRAPSRSHAGRHQGSLLASWMDIADGPRPPESCAAAVEADRNPEQVMSALKAYASRALNETGIDRTGRRRWARHGSTRYLWTMTEIAAAV